MAESVDQFRVLHSPYQLVPVLLLPELMEALHEISFELRAESHWVALRLSGAHPLPLWRKRLG